VSNDLDVPGGTADPKGKGARRAEKGDTIVRRAARRAHDDDHGGNWKVAFADFCLALMCLFLLLWVLGAREEEEARHQLTELAQRTMYDGSSGLHPGVDTVAGRYVGIDDSIVVPRDMRASTPETPAGERVALASEDDLHALALRISQLGAEAGLSDNLQTIVTPYGLRVLLHDTDDQGIFERGSAAPTQPFRPLLKRLGGLFEQIGNPLLAIGHTDSVPYRSIGFGSRSNWHLSTDRAMSARRAVLEGGMPPAQVLQVVGMADRAPLSGDPRAALNRRIEFLVLTPQRARMIEAMFGRPVSVVPLIDGVNAVGASSEGDAAEIAAAVEAGRPAAPGENADS
jgi:chemotaxis protein MotB